MIIVNTRQFTQRPNFVLRKIWPCLYAVNILESVNEYFLLYLGVKCGYWRIYTLEFDADEMSRLMVMPNRFESIDAAQPFINEYAYDFLDTYMDNKGMALFPSRQLH